jgi:hypothetical protein
MAVWEGTPYTLPSAVTVGRNESTMFSTNASSVIGTKDSVGLSAWNREPEL